MRRLHLLVPFLLTVPSATVTTSARPVRLDWGSVNILMMADSTRGTLIWGARNTAVRHNFVAYVEPAAAYEWTQQLRQFLALSLTSADSGELRMSSMLRSKQGDAIYFVRLKHEGRWTDERVIVMQGSSQESARLIIDATDQNAIEFLEALESVNAQALNMPRTEVLDSIPVLNPLDPGTGPVAQKDSPAVRYPAGDRREGNNGDVWLSYVVTASGAVDPTSIEVLLSDGRGFESSVREMLVNTRFTPAQLNGAPISIRVFQHFRFLIIRCKGRDLGSTRVDMYVETTCGPPETGIR